METHEQVLAIVNKVYFRMLWCLVSIVVLVLLYGVCDLLYKEYVQTYDFSPLEPIPVILKHMKSNDQRMRWSAVYQLSRYGERAVTYLPELHDLYLIGFDEDDPILTKNIHIKLATIVGSQAEADRLIESWRMEWAVKNPIEAAKLGYKVAP